jgi:hypothetical protein
MEERGGRIAKRGGRIVKREDGGERIAKRKCWW